MSICLKDHIPTFSSITTVRTSSGDRTLSPKTDTPISTIARLHLDSHFIHKFHLYPVSPALRDKSEDEPYSEFKYLSERAWFKATPFLTGFTDHGANGGRPPNPVGLRAFVLHRLWCRVKESGRRHSPASFLFPSSHI